MNLKKLITELKRRNVFKVAMAYSIAGWLIIQVATSVFPAFKFPAWTTQFVIILVLIGFPIAIILAWAFEMTPDGVKRTEDVPEEKSVTVKTGRKLNTILVVMLILAVGGLFYQHFYTGNSAISRNNLQLKTTTDSLSVPSKSIAVLPFENLSADSNNAYFAAGMQDMILTKLADIGDLGVLSRTSTKTFSSHPNNLGSIAKQLGVYTFLEGSVQKAGNQVLINVQLIDARNEHHIWAHAYTRTLNNIFGVEGEVADKIAQTLKLKLLPAEKKELSTKPTDNPRAYDLFLQAKYQYDQFSKKGSLPKNALELFHRSIQLDTTFALAYAWLARTEVFMGFLGNADSLNQQALQHARKSIALRPRLATGYYVLGYLYSTENKNEIARTEWEKALQYSPNNLKVLASLSSVNQNQGRWDEALANLNKSLSLDPHNTVNIETLAELKWRLRHYKTAMQLFKKANRLDPGQTDAIWADARMLTTIGQMQQAHELLDLNAQATSSTLNAYDLSNSYAEYYYYNHNYQKSLAYIDSASSIWPKLMPHMQSQATFTPYALSRLVFWQYPVRGQLYTLTGKPRKAHALMQKAITLLNTSQTHELRFKKIYRLYSLALCRSINGEFKKAVLTINKAIKLSPVTEYYLDFYHFQEALCEIYARAGDADKAIPILQQIFKARGTGEIITAHVLKNDPVWNPIRKDPRFQALIQKYAPLEQETGS
ncbi:MAG TPA: hypothetical protein VKA08_03110 [Balneolales bacterium]|nr:hypothetical protein [Balneolales bacterium]